MWRWGALVAISEDHGKRRNEHGEEDVAEAAAQTRTDVEKGKEKEKDKGKEKEKDKGKEEKKSSNTPAAKPEVSEVSGGAAGHLQRFPFVEDLSEYEEEEGKEEETTTKAVVVHGVPTNWRINGVPDCAERIKGEIIGVRWLLNERRREGKAASSVVVYLQNEVFLRPEACMKMSGKRHSVVVYRWRA